MTNPNGLNGTTYVQQNPQQLFQGQPQQQQQFVQNQQGQPQQQQQQQFAQSQQPQQQPQQVVVQQPNYQNGQVSMNGQNFSTNELSPKAQEVFDMIQQGVNKMALSNGNAQQQQQGIMTSGNVVYQQLPNGQLVPVIMNQQQPVPIQQQPQQQDQGMFSGWKGKVALVGVGGLAGYGISKMMGSGPSAGDVAALTNGVQVLSKASSSDIMKALFG